MTTSAVQVVTDHATVCLREIDAQTLTFGGYPPTQKNDRSFRHRTNLPRRPAASGARVARVHVDGWFTNTWYLRPAESTFESSPSRSTYRRLSCLPGTQHANVNAASQRN